jgi:hypothetical protein
MALGLTSVFYGNAGSINFVTGIIAFDSSYPTGGEALTAANLGLSTIQFIHIQHTKGFSFEYDYTNAKLIAYSQGAAHGTGGAVTLDDYPITAGPGVTSGISISLTTGAGAATANLGPLKEIASTDDLSTVTGVRFFAVGF